MWWRNGYSDGSDLTIDLDFGISSINIDYGEEVISIIIFLCLVNLVSSKIKKKIQT